MNTRRVTMKEFGVRWHYWLCAVGFLLFGIFGCYNVKFEPENKLFLLWVGSAFALIGILALVWPLIRIQESQGARYISQPTKRLPFRGIFIRASSAKIVVGLIGGFVMCLMVVLALFSDRNIDEQKVKGVLALAIGLGLLFQFFHNFIFHAPGVMLSSGGIAWQDYFMPPCFIEWDQITRASVYSHQEKYTKSLSFGLAVADVDRYNISPRMRRKLEGHYHRHGWHLRYSAESLLEPLDVVEWAINFYRTNANERAELETTVALSRIKSFENKEEKLQAVATQ